MSNYIFRAISTVCERHPKLHCYAIVDLGKEETYFEVLQKFSFKNKSLFVGTLEEDLYKLGPWMIEFDIHLQDSKEFAEWLEQLTDKKNAVLWVLSFENFESVYQHLQHMLDWKTHTGQAALIRYYDANVFFRFIDILTEPQKALFFTDIYCCAVIGRTSVRRRDPPISSEKASDKLLSEQQLKIFNLPDADVYLNELLIELQENSKHAPVFHQDKTKTLVQMKAGWKAGINMGIYNVPTLSQFAAFAVIVPQFWEQDNMTEYVKSASNEREADLRARDVFTIMARKLYKFIDSKGK